LSGPGQPTRFGTTPPGGTRTPRPAFFAYDRPIAGTIPITADGGLRAGIPGETRTVFHALPGSAKDGSGTTVPLYEYRERGGTARVYSVDARPSLPGYERVEEPLCRVWAPDR